MINLKQKLNDAWQWTKRKFKEIVISLGIVSVAMAAGTQTTLLDTSPINYPLTANTNLEKLEYLYESQEALRLQHNEMGRQYREGIISVQEWEKYKKEEFLPKSRAIGEGTAVIGDKLENVVLNVTATSTGEMVQSIIPARQFYKEFMKHSTNWSVDLNTILK